MSFPGRMLQRAWHLVDAKDQTTGRLASQIASILRGKHKPTFHPSHDMGDTVVVINAEQVKFTGDKWKKKLYRWHTGHPGGLKQRTAVQMLEKNPTQILRKAILGMLKRTRLRNSAMESRLKIYTGSEHPHTAQLLPHMVQPLPRVPHKLHANWHFGLGKYADDNSYLEDRIHDNLKQKRQVWYDNKNGDDSSITKIATK